MKTYFFGEEEVRGYIRDLLDRMDGMESPPSVRCPITKSGEAFLNAILPEISHRLTGKENEIRVIPIEVDSEQKTVSFKDSDYAEAISGKHVFLIDGAIHSGNVMSLCQEAVSRLGSAEVSSYSLVLKCGSKFIPTMWGVMIDETDRAYFLLEKIPNNRLCAHHTRPQPPVHIERMSEKHVTLPELLSGVPSMDRVTWGDRFYDMTSSSHAKITYMLTRAGAIMGFLTVSTPKKKSLCIEEIVVAPEHRQKGYGGILLRFADTFARHRDCIYVTLNAIENRIAYYESFDYHCVPDSKPIKLNSELYFPMRRRVLYSQCPCDIDSETA
ncbi:MAG: GNAT family N-acetyltransferase [Opitutales bacterium]|jgi:GNAT superfamily N-acetyltransferase/hypoxanthine-guanine phosphoribosyltransferase